MPVRFCHVHLRLESRPYYLHGDYGFGLDQFGAAHFDFKRDGFPGDKNVGRYYFQIELALLGAALEVVRDHLVEVKSDLAAVTLGAGGLLLRRQRFRAAATSTRPGGFGPGRRDSFASLSRSGWLAGTGRFELFWSRGLDTLSRDLTRPVIGVHRRHMLFQ